MRNRLSFLASAGLILAATGAAMADDVKVSGQLGLNYTYNFNKPSSRNNSYLFNGKDAQFSVNLAEIKISKEPTADHNAGFVIRLIDGEVADYFKSVLTGGNSNLYEAYGIVTGNFGDKDFRVEAGQWRALTGHEDVGFGDFVSRSYSFALLQPIIGKGVRATWSLDEDTSITGVLQNSFNGTEDGNKDLTFGFQYKRALGEDSSLKVNLMTGREQVDSFVNTAQTVGVNREASMANVVYTRAFGENTHFALDGTLRFGKDVDDRSYDVSGIAAYLTRKTGNGAAVSVRGEYLSQNNATSGLLPTGPDARKKPTLTSITLSYQLPGSTEGTRTILEYRYDRAADFVFEKGSSSLKKDQSSISIGQIFRY